MSKPSRACADCGTHINDRHRRAERCEPCAAERYRMQGASKRTRTMYDHICGHCSTPFRTRVKRQQYCGGICSGLASHPGDVEKACIVCAVQFTISRQYERDTCSKPCTKWAREHPGELPIRSCTFCGAAMNGKHKDAAYCSRRCSVSHHDRLTGKVARPLDVTYICLRCGDGLTGRPLNTQYCSRACQAREQAERRSRKKSNAPVEPVRPGEVFARDNWTCHLCSEPIDRTLRHQHPMMVSLDHIIPINAPDYPGHVWENLAPAHLRCNIRKGSTPRPEDWNLYRTLVARRLTWPEAKPPTLQQQPACAPTG